MKITNLIRRIIQVVFFFTLPALYTSAFSGVKYVFRRWVQVRWLKIILFWLHWSGCVCLPSVLEESSADLRVHSAHWEMPCMVCLRFCVKKWSGNHFTFRRRFQSGSGISNMSYWHFLLWCVFWERTISLQRKVRGKYFPLSMRDILISRHTYRESLFLPESWWECSFRRDSSASIYARWEQYFPCCRCCRYSHIREAEAVVSGAAVPAVRNVRWI